MIRKAVIVMVVLAFLVSTAQAKRLDVVTADGSSMTAGGFLDTGLFKVHHTLSLDCDGTSQNSLKVDWDNNMFQLDAVTQPLSCTYDATGYGTVSGSGSGTLNGVPATIKFSFTDNGEPGTNDYGMIHITDVNGFDQYFIAPLTGGNYQMHN